MRIKKSRDFNENLTLQKAVPESIKELDIVFRAAAVDEDKGEAGVIKYVLSADPLEEAIRRSRSSKSSRQVFEDEVIPCDDPLDAFAIIKDTGQVYAKHRWVESNHPLYCIL